jgi:hypothetical protein
MGKGGGESGCCRWGLLGMFRSYKSTLGDDGQVCQCVWLVSWLPILLVGANKVRF